jgi:hypothetical protein
MTLALFGVLIFLIGINPDLLGMNRSLAVGFVQVGVWLTGMGIFLLGAYGALRVVRNGRQTSLLSEVGLRLAATGYVIAAAASLADFIGIGSHTIRALVFGKIQTAGLVFGILLILLGLVLYYPRAPREATQQKASTPPADRGLSQTPRPAKSVAGR